MDSIDKINVFLARKGMSGADLERAIGVSNSVYSQWNTKTTKPSKSSLAKVAAVLDIDVSEIMPDKIDQKQKSPTPEGVELSEKKRALIQKVILMDDSMIDAMIIIADQILAQRGQ